MEKQKQKNKGVSVSHGYSVLVASLSDCKALATVKP